MSLGGYKFAGRFCQKGSLTDQQWALLMHKTKVAAFMAANTLSGSGWDYDMTGSPDGNYHCLDSVGNNYVTCFKNTSKGSYFAIYTLTAYRGSNAQTGEANVKLIPDKSTSGYYLCPGATSFVRVSSSSSIPYDSTAFNESDMTSLFPTGYTWYNYFNSPPYGQTNSLFNKASNYYGFAVKDDNIIMLSGWDYTTSGIYATFISAHAFASLIDSSDTKSEFCMSVNIPERGSSYYETTNAYTLGRTGVSHTLQNNGVPCLSNTDLNMFAWYYGAIQNYPFQSLGVTSVSNGNIYGKGTLNIDFCAVNTTSDVSSVPAKFSDVANGNLLTVGQSSSAQAYYFFDREYKSLYSVVYCGWDASNPDITQASAWTEYTDA